VTGWPWPLDGVQRWFEDLWNHIIEAATNAVKIVSDWIWGAIRWLKDEMSPLLGWLWDQIKPMLGPIGDWIEQAAKWAWSQLWEFVKDPVGYITRGVKWIGEQLSHVASSLGESLRNIGGQVLGAMDGFKNWLIGGLEKLWGDVSGAIGGAVDAIGKGLENAKNAIGSWVSDALSGVAKALGEGLTAFWGWLREQVSGFISWLVQGITWLGEQLKSIFSGLANMILAPVTEALKPGSPDKLTEQVSLDFGQALMDKVMAEAEKISGSPVEPEKALAGGVAVLGAVTLMQSVGNVLTMAFDATHPVKSWGTQEMFNRIVLNLMQSPVTSAVIGIPMTVGILTPMRQAFLRLYRSTIPSTGQADQMLFEQNITPEEWRAIYQYSGWSEERIDAWYKTMWREPAQRTLLTMLEDPEISEEWIRKKLREIGFIGEDQDILIAYKRRLIQAKKTAGLLTEAARLVTNAKSDAVKGYITGEDLRATLKILNLPDAEIEYHVKDAVEDRQRWVNDQMVAAIEDQFAKGLIEEPGELGERLTGYIAVPDVIEARVQLAAIKRFKKPKEGTPTAS